MIEEFDKIHLKPKIIFGFSAIIVVLILIVSSVYFLVIPPKIVATSPKSLEANGSLKKLEVKFNKPVNRNSLEIAIDPEVKGQLKYEDNLVNSHLYTKAVFVPDTSLSPETNYKVTIKSIESYWGNRERSNYSFEFKTQSIPKIVSSTPENGTSGVFIDSSVDFLLDQKNDRIANFSFAVSPETPFTQETNPEKTAIKIKFAEPLKQDVDYTISCMRSIADYEGENIVKETPPEKNYELKFKTKPSPRIADYSPKGSGVFVSQNQIAIEFKEDMNQESFDKFIALAPSVSGQWSWQDSKKIVYTLSEKLKYSTEYKVTIKSGTKDKNGGFLEKDEVLSFSTIGYVTLSDTYPKNNASGVSASSKISITFNQEVDHASAESSFVISPAVQGAMSWQGNKMIFTPAGLGQNSSYKIILSSGIKSINGLDSNRQYEINFSTEETNVVLNVPIDYQDKPLSCEAASLKMALRYKGASVSENDIMNIIGFDPTIRSKNTWGDPHVAFVGDINGRQNTTGYGVYWEPIAKAANHFRSSKAFTGGTAAYLASEISNGNPVVIWGVYGNGYRDDWQTPEGKQILAWKGEHARVAIGFRGPVDNPREFIINDPIAGRVTWSKAKFLADWSTFGNSGVVVY